MTPLDARRMLLAFGLAPLLACGGGAMGNTLATRLRALMGW